jgi:hypothetical protein
MPTLGHRPPKRYWNDGRPALTLSTVQSRQRERFLERLADGTYHWEEVPTCVCGSEDMLPVSEKDRFGLPVGVVVCTQCGLVRTSPRLAAENLPTFYDLDYHALHQGIVNPTPDTALFREGQGSTIYDSLRAYLPEGRLLIAEIGAATGGVLREFAAAAGAEGRQVDLVGCEYAREFVDVGRAAGTDLRLGGVEALIGNAPADVLIMSHVLEHFSDPVAELVRIRSLLNARAIVYVEVPGIRSIHTKPEYEFDFLEYLTIAHTFHFSRGSLIRTMRRAGFEVVSADEEVRGVFMLADLGKAAAASRLDPPTSDADDLIAYLRRLDSGAMRSRRGRLRLANESRRRIKRVLQPVVGERLWGRARLAWRDLRRFGHSPRA